MEEALQHAYIHLLSSFDCSFHLVPRFLWQQRKMCTQYTYTDSKSPTNALWSLDDRDDELYPSFRRLDNWYKCDDT